MPAHRVVWTPTMIAALTSMRGQGVALVRCAKLLGVDYQVAAVKARELGLQGRRRGVAHRYIEAEPDLRKRWSERLPAMRDAVKRDAECPGKPADQGQEACSSDAAPSMGGERHLSASEQRIMRTALRRSSRLIDTADD